MLQSIFLGVITSYAACQNTHISEIKLILTLLALETFWFSDTHLRPNPALFTIRILFFLNTNQAIT